MKVHLSSFENIQLWCLIKANAQHSLYSKLLLFCEKENSFLFDSIYYTVVINQAILIKIVTEKVHAKKLMRKSAESMSKVLHSMNCSPFRKKPSPDVFTCLSAYLGNRSFKSLISISGIMIIPLFYPTTSNKPKPCKLSMHYQCSSLEWGQKKSGLIDIEIIGSGRHFLEG